MMRQRMAEDMGMACNMVMDMVRGYRIQYIMYDQAHWARRKFARHLAHRRDA